MNKLELQKMESEWKLKRRYHEQVRAYENCE